MLEVWLRESVFNFVLRISNFQIVIQVCQAAFRQRGQRHRKGHLHYVFSVDIKAGLKWSLLFEKRKRIANNLTWKCVNFTIR